MKKIPYLALLLMIGVILSSSLEAKSIQTTGGGGGRFQLVQLSDYAKHQFLIDTQTGRIWNNVCAKQDAEKECSLRYWSEELVEGISVSTQQIQKILQSSTEDSSKKRDSANKHNP